MTVSLSIKDDKVEGEVALDIAPGTVAAECNRALAAALVEPLTEAARSLQVVLAAAPNKFVQALPGKDAQGRTRYRVCGRAEGGRLVPDRRK
jgi:hypothetical protein